MSESEPLARTAFHTGQLLTAEDFTREQDYLRDKQKRHNRALHGFGVVSGLKVTIGCGRIVVEPGLAFDCDGNEIVIPARQELPPLSATNGSSAAYVNIRYVEETSDAACIGDESEALLLRAVTIIESFEICIGQENQTRGHRHLRSKWTACGEVHALTIAKLKCSAQGWRVDRRYRAPIIR